MASSNGTNNAMCDERERLIGYVYDECAPEERAEVQAHLTACPVCREEIGALRAVREDLLAWDVPEHESVWRPFAPPRATPSWRDLSAWALAAAAGIIFMVGLAGGVAARGWFSMAGTPVSASADASEAGAVPVTVTAADLEQLEQRLRADLMGRMNQIDQRVQVLGAQTPAAAARAAAPRIDTAALQELRTRVERIEALSYNQALLNAELDNKIGRFLNISTRTGRNDLLQPVSFGGSIAR
jgi:anti-sigma factor RsiW